MSVKKAIKILNWWIDQKEKSMKETIRVWNYDSIKDANGTAQLLLDVDKTVINNLNKIRDELVPKCNHPKNMIDTVGNQKYCMNCNLDL